MWYRKHNSWGLNWGPYRSQRDPQTPARFKHPIPLPRPRPQADVRGEILGTKLSRFIQPQKVYLKTDYFSQLLPANAVMMPKPRLVCCIILLIFYFFFLPIYLFAAIWKDPGCGDNFQWEGVKGECWKSFQCWLQAFVEFILTLSHTLIFTYICVCACGRACARIQIKYNEIVYWTVLLEPTLTHRLTHKSDFPTSSTGFWFCDFWVERRCREGSREAPWYSGRRSQDWGNCFFSLFPSSAFFLSHSLRPLFLTSVFSLYWFCILCHCFASSLTAS